VIATVASRVDGSSGNTMSALLRGSPRCGSVRVAPKAVIAIQRMACSWANRWRRAGRWARTGQAENLPGGRPPVSKVL
jgi:hypothetical protein